MRKPRRLATVNGESLVLARQTLVPQITRGVSFRAAYPQMKRCILRYSDLFPVTAVAAATTRYFQANSLFDFDATGTGHQPRLYDQHCTSTGPYVVYRVLGIRIRVTLAPTWSAGATPPAQTPTLLVAGFSLGAAPTAPSGSIASNIWGNTEIAGWSGCLVPLTGAKSIEFNRTMASIFGVPEQHIKGEDNYQGSYNANPANICYFYVQIQSGDVATSQNVALLVDAEFDVQFEDPLQQTPS